MMILIFLGEQKRNRESHACYSHRSRCWRNMGKTRETSLFEYSIQVPRKITGDNNRNQNDDLLWRKIIFLFLFFEVLVSLQRKEQSSCYLSFSCYAKPLMCGILLMRAGRKELDVIYIVVSLYKGESINGKYKQSIYWYLNLINEKIINSPFFIISSFNVISSYRAVRPKSST